MLGDKDEMEILEIVDLDKRKVKISLDTGLEFCLYKKEAGFFSLQEGSDLSLPLWMEIRNTVLLKRAKKRAAYLLERMDRTEAQVAAKLKENLYPEDVIEETVRYLVDNRYIDDSRYACSYIRCCQARKSKYQIHTALIGKGIPSEVIQDALEEAYDANEDELIQSILTKQKFSPETSGYKEKAKLYQQLARRGFPCEKIRKHIGT